MPLDELMAITRLRQWSVDKIACRTPRVTHVHCRGWKVRNDRMHDARLVRVLDFERALSRLSQGEQIALVLTYRDRVTIRDLSRALEAEPHIAHRLVLTARRHLADILDRFDLL